MTDFMSYRNAAAAMLAPDALREVDDRLQLLLDTAGEHGRMRALIDATQTDTRVQKDLWRGFFDVVLRAIPASIESDIRDWARRNSVRGKRAGHSSPLVTVQSRARFEEYLQDQTTSAGRKIGPSTARSLTNELTSPDKWRHGCSRANDLGLKMKQYTTWATFSIPYQPFAGLPLTANEIACELGLDDPTCKGISFRTPLIVFEYSPSGLAPRIPTMIEAWGSDIPNYYFRPAQGAAAKHGMTWPWPTAPAGTRGRPEVVHSPASLAVLSRDARVIRR